jgi:hypothetical protein
VASPLQGSEEARLWTRPLRPLTPETSLGFLCIAFALEILGVDLDRWQKWFLIHALEINPDGSFRFRTILLLVARQNGKTTVMRVLTLWLLWTGRVKLAVGTAQDLDIARRNWREACAVARNAADVRADLDGRPRMANGQESLLFRNGAEYIIKATTADAARGIPGVGLLLADELRTHRDYEAWGAMSKTAMAVPNALIVGMSNAGDDQSIVLNDLREKALAGADETLGLFEWSAEPGCDLDDPAAWVQANPSLGHGRLSERAIRSSMLSDPPAVFRTEVLCQRVEQLRGAVDKLAWQGGADPAGTLDGLRDRLFACVELAEGTYGEHATLCVAAINDAGKAIVEVVEAWTSYATMEAELPELLGRVEPAGRFFFPTGPAAAKAGFLRALEFRDIKGAAVQESCMGFAADVRAGQLVHRDDPLLTAHVVGAERMISGDGWRFTRGGNVDAAYAAAGAVWAARNHADLAYDLGASLLWNHEWSDPNSRGRVQCGKCGAVGDPQSGFIYVSGSGGRCAGRPFAR